MSSQQLFPNEFDAPSPDRLATEESKKLYDDSYDSDVEKIVTRTLKFDFYARYIVAFIVFVIVFGNYGYIVFLVFHCLFSSCTNKAVSIIETYIKYAVGFNSGLLLIMGYWFSSSGSLGLLKNAHLQSDGRRSKRFRKSLGERNK